MITTVTLNPAIDKTILIGRLNVGSVNRLESAREDIGGKGINVAKLLHNLDTKTQATGFIGKTNKKQVFEMLDHEGLKYHFVEVDAPTRTNTKVVELEVGETTDLNEPGFSVTSEQFEALKRTILTMAQESSYIVFSGSVPKGLDSSTYYDLVQLVKSKTLTALDADGPLLMEGLKAGPSLIKPNIHELEAAFDVSLTTDREVIGLCKKLIEDYGIQMILVSMGGDGSLLVTRFDVYKAKPIKVQVKSTVGAGDSMLAGFLYGLDKGLSKEEALAFATACGTLAVTKEGTQTFSMEEVLEMMDKVDIDQVLS